jgi:hypothetical protein
VIVELSIAFTAIATPTALIVWLLLRALRRSRVADGKRPSPPGFDVVAPNRPVV